jgi:hypothetical protein
MFDEEYKLWNPIATPNLYKALTELYSLILFISAARAKNQYNGMKHSSHQDMKLFFCMCVCVCVCVWLILKEMQGKIISDSLQCDVK